ncbi:MAG: ATP-binding protein [Desulfomicrobium escambiense]|nr:ATP-binding protein [Desulfomicrobium escambiense]
MKLLHYISIFSRIFPLSLKKISYPPFLVDRDGLKRAIINLITNSVKAIDNNQGVIKITTQYDVVKGTGIIEVSDTGKGIPDEDKSKIFDPYFTKDKDGMGLGLAIVHSIILEHHWQDSRGRQRPLWRKVCHRIAHRWKHEKCSAFGLPAGPSAGCFGPQAGGQIGRREL